MALNEQEEFELLSLEREKSGKFDPSVGNLRYQANRTAKGFGGLMAIPATAIEMAQKQAIPTSLLGIGAKLLPAASGQKTQETIGGMLGYDPAMKPPSRGAEVLGGVSEFAGASLLPSAGVISKAAHVAPAIASEIGSTILGGLGSEIAGLPGALVGSVSGANIPMLYSKAKSLVSGVVPWLRNKNAAIAPKELNSAIQSHPDSAMNVGVADEVSDNLQKMGAGEFKPTLAGKTGAPGIVAREAQVAGSSAEDLSRYRARQAGNEAVVQNAGQIAFPEGRDLQRTAESVRLSATSMLEKKLDTISKQREGLTKMMQSSPQQDVGNRLVMLRDEAQNVAKGIKDTKLNSVYEAADRLGIKDSMDDVLATVRKIGGDDANIFQNMPPIYGKVLREYSPKQAELTGRSIDPELMAHIAQTNVPKPATFKEIHSLWREANTQYGAALRSGDSQSMHYVQQVRDALKSKLAKFEQGGFGEVTEKFKDFNKFYATKYAPVFKEGVGGRLSATNRYGEIVKPEDVVSKFFNPTGIDDFNAIYGANPQAQSALTDGVVGLFRQSAVKGGVINKTSADTFLRNNAEALDKVPDIKAMLANPAAANEALIEQALRVKSNQSKITNSVISKLAKTDNLPAMVESAMTDRKAMAQLMSLASRGGEGGKKELARLIAERVPEAAKKAGVDPFTYVAQNRAILEPTLSRLGENHFKNLLTLTGAKTILGRTEIPKNVGAPQVKDIMEEMTGTGMPSLISMGRATTITRQSSPVYMLTNVLAKFGVKLRKENVEDLMREAIYNPDMATLWAKAAQTGKLSIPESNRILNHISAAGIRIGSTQVNE